MKERWFQESATAKQMQLRSPLAVLVQNSNVGNAPTQQHLINHCRVAVDDGKQPQHNYFISERKYC